MHDQNGPVDADVLILGGGCAGLSLAARLALPGRPPLRTIVLEAGAGTTETRTFSFWRDAPHLFSGAVGARWETWRVGTTERCVTRDAPGLAYETIAGADFAAMARRLIDAAPHVALRLECPALAHGTDADGVWVDTPAGRLRAALLVDTRPPPPRAHTGLLQVFTGCEVRAARPVFNPAAAELMRFDTPHPAHVGFCYVLPFAPDRALVEYTRFAVDDVAPPAFSETMARVRLLAGRDVEVLRVESGRLAMHVAPAADFAGSFRVVRLGIAGGAARPSTGYAFAAIQRQADALARVLQAGPRAAFGWRAPRAPRWLLEMDRAFLRVLRRNPQLGPRLFTDLFAHCPPAALVRFLSGDPSALDAARVAAALPPWPFVRGLLRAPSAVRAVAVPA